MVDEPRLEPWYSVRCVFASDGKHGTLYEERVTLWRAGSFEEAVARAEREAREYAEDLDAEYVGLAQAYHLGIVDREPGEGDEIFSLIRDSDLSPHDYLSQYFDTGSEHQGSVE